MGLVPMKLGKPDLTVCQANRSDALHLAPATRAVAPSEASKIPDRPADGDRFNVSDLADDLEPPSGYSGVDPLMVWSALMTWR